MKVAAVIYVLDLGRMRAFYGECFELETVALADDHCVLESDDRTLSLVQIPADTAAAVQLPVPPDRRRGTPIKLVFDVAAIDDVRPLVTGHGGHVDPGDTAWDFRGARHCDGVDPEGNIIQLRQPARP